MEMVTKQFRLYKPVAKAFKQAVFDSEERYGYEMSQQELANRIFAKFLGVDIEKELAIKNTPILVTGDEDDERSDGGVDLIEDQGSSIPPLDPKLMNEIVKMLKAGEPWLGDFGVRTRVNAILPVKFDIGLYEEEIKDKCFEEGIPVEAFLTVSKSAKQSLNLEE